MIRRYGNLLRLALMLFDGGLAIALSLLLYHWAAHPNVPTSQFIAVFWARAILYGITWVGILYVHGGYRLRAHWTIGGEISMVMRATSWLTVAGVVFLLLAATDITGSGWALLLFPLQGVLAVAVRIVLRLTFMYFRRRGHNVRNVVILGTGPEAAAFTELVHEHSVLGVKVIGYLGPEPPAVGLGAPYWGQCAELPQVLRREIVDEVAVCVAEEDWPRVEELVQLAHEEGKLIRIPLAVPQLRTSHRFLEDLDGTAVLSYVNGPDELTAHAVKRLIDFVIAGIVLLLTLPLLLVIATVLRIRQGPGVFFRHRRVGIHGRIFSMYKFRTMVPDAEERYPELAHLSDTLGAAFKLKDDPRVTPSGHLLRRYSLDELPQLWNVIRGEMSIVGPRPAPVREVKEYDIWHRRRLSVKPGITGLWQITRDYGHFDGRAHLDMEYIDRWSIRLDLYIIFRTIPAVLRRPSL
jgi:exopolysaccharide biosynthesis polyprenyl glycosylphosphotransferase